MAAFTSKAAGNWSASGQTTWTEAGVPGNGDTVIITHAIVVDGNTTVGHSPGAADATAAIRLNTGGSLTINAGITLTVRGDVLKGANNAASITMAAGSTFQFDASAASVPSTAIYKFSSNDSRTGLYFQCNGTSGSHCTITSVKTSSAASGRIVVDQDESGQIVGTWTDISYLGSASAYGWGFSLSTSGDSFDLTDCTFDNCGVIGSGTNAVDGSIFNLKRVKITNSLNTSLSPNASLQVRFTAAKTSGTRSIDLCALDKALYGSGFYGLSVTNTVLLYGCSADAQNSTSAGTFSGNYVDNDSVNAVIPFPTVDATYFAFRVNQAHGVTSPAAQLAAVYSNNVFEWPACVNTTDNGDGIFPAQPASAKTLAITGNLLLPIAIGARSGYSPATLYSDSSSSGNANLSVSAEHNTYCVTRDATLPGDTAFRVSETDPLHAGAVTSFKSNLAWAASANSNNQWLFCDMHATPNTDVLATANCVKNAYHNASPGSGTLPATGYKGKWSSAPGTTDVDSGDPLFVDPTRNIITWAADNGQASTLAAAEAYLAADPARIALLYAWVRDGWNVQNTLLKNAGHDGVTIGALEYVAPASTGSIASALIAIGVI